MGRLGAGVCLDAGAAFACGAGLGAGGALVFPWLPQASTEKIIKTKSTVAFLMTPLFGMLRSLAISCSSESFLCDFTDENGGKSEIP